MSIRDYLRPIVNTNRNYLGKENHRKQYIYIHLITLVGLIVMLFVMPSLWFIWLGVLVLVIVEYFTIDKFSDNLTWKLFGKFYDAHAEPDKEHQAMQDYEQNPSKENLDKIQKHIK